MEKRKVKKLFFAYDDRKIFTCICFLLCAISIAIFWALIASQNTDIFAYFILFIIFALASFCAIFILFIGIHCNLKKRTIKLVGRWPLIEKIEFDKISHITLERAYKERKKSALPLFKESLWYLNTEYVYNNGEVFVVKFHLKNQQTVEMYYSWLFGAKNKKRVEKQKHKLELFVSQMNDAIRKKKTSAIINGSTSNTTII